MAQNSRQRADIMQWAAMRERVPSALAFSHFQIGNNSSLTGSRNAHIF